MYDVRPNTLIGFHGCDLDIRNKLVNNPDYIEISKKPYDWLGHGMYFWENNYTRAMQWAEDKAAKGKIKTPGGAVVKLCLSVLTIILGMLYCRLLFYFFSLVLFNTLNHQEVNWGISDYILCETDIVSIVTSWILVVITCLWLYKLRPVETKTLIQPQE